MSSPEKTLDRILRGTNDANLRFADVCGLLRHLGFQERIRGDHHIFTRENIVEIINIQPRQGKGKPYQIRQIRELIVRYKLAAQGPDESSDEEHASPRDAPEPEKNDGE